MIDAKNNDVLKIVFILVFHNGGELIVTELIREKKGNKQ
jgi:hypothetical protein